MTTKQNPNSVYVPTESSDIQRAGPRRTRWIGPLLLAVLCMLPPGVAVQAAPGQQGATPPPPFDFYVVVTDKTGSFLGNATVAVTPCPACPTVSVTTATGLLGGLGMLTLGYPNGVGDTIQIEVSKAG